MAMELAHINKQAIKFYPCQAPLEEATHSRTLKSARLARKSRARLAREWPPRGRQKLVQQSKDEISTDWISGSAGMPERQWN